MSPTEGEINSADIMRQFAQALIRIIQYGQRDMNVARASQGQTMAPGSSFGPPAESAPQADQPEPAKPRSSPDNMYALREKAVQEAKRRQREMIAKQVAGDAEVLTGPNLFTEPVPQPTAEGLDIGQSATIRGNEWTRTGEDSWNFRFPKPPPETPVPPPPPAVVRTPQTPNASDTWGNWQDTQVDVTTTRGTDNTQPDATQTGVDLRNQLNRMNDNMGKLFDQITKSLIKINQRLEQIEASFESRECV